MLEDVRALCRAGSGAGMLGRRATTCVTRLNHCNFNRIIKHNYPLESCVLRDLLHFPTDVPHIQM